jgi:hypothetical protein
MRELCKLVKWSINREMGCDAGLERMRAAAGRPVTNELANWFDDLKVCFQACNSDNRMSARGRPCRSLHKLTLPKADQPGLQWRLIGKCLKSTGTRGTYPRAAPRLASPISGTIRQAPIV